MTANYWGVTRALVVVICLACLSCESSPFLDPVESSEPELVREPILPDLAYLAWWDQLESCSGATGDFSRLRFFQVLSPLFVEDSQFPCGNGFFCNGIWESPHNISIAPALLNSRRLIKHEMLHDLLETIDHPDVFDACDAAWDFSDVRGRGRDIP